MKHPFINGIPVRELVIFRKRNQWSYRITDENGRHVVGRHYGTSEAAEEAMLRRLEVKEMRAFGSRKNPHSCRAMPRRVNQVKSSHISRKNPRSRRLTPRQQKKYVLYARKGAGPRMHYDGKRFSDHGKPALFASIQSAADTGKFLLDAFPLLRGYALTAESAAGTGAVRKKNPDPLPRGKRRAWEIEQARKRLADFSGHEPTRIMKVRERSPKVGLVIGDLDGVLYSTTRDGRRERYVHEFRKRSRPLLAASSDGKSLRILGGGFEFTEAGIEDR